MPTLNPNNGVINQPRPAYRVVSVEVFSVVTLICACGGLQPLTVKEPGPDNAVTCPGCRRRYFVSQILYDDIRQRETNPGTPAQLACSLTVLEPRIASPGAVRV